MPGSSSALGGKSESNSEFRVEKLRTEATLTLSNGASVPGYFFVAGSGRTHTGPERIKDLLNEEAGFFPFELAGGPSTVMYNRDHVVMVQVADQDEPHADPGYDVATVRGVTMLLSNGVRMRGAVRVRRPHGRDRLSDFARDAETFGYLEAQHATYLINVRHVLELAEEAPA